jgi:NAD(P)H-hydrate epimerase
MIKLFETAKLKELEQYTIDHEPIVSIELVERAAVAFVKKYGHHYPRHKYKHVFVLAGQGNNGADALAIARLLAEDNYPVEAYLFNPTMHLSPDCEFNKQRLLNEHKVRLVEVFHNFEPPEMTSKDVVIDGLFGSGLNRPLSGGFAGVVNYVNQSEEIGRAHV